MKNKSVFGYNPHAFNMRIDGRPRSPRIHFDPNAKLMPHHANFDDLPENAVIVITGEAGCGKTTLAEKITVGHNTQIINYCDLGRFNSAHPPNI